MYPWIVVPAQMRLVTAVTVADTPAVCHGVASPVIIPVAGLAMNRGAVGVVAGRAGMRRRWIRIRCEFSLVSGGVVVERVNRFAVHSDQFNILLIAGWWGI